MKIPQFITILILALATQQTLIAQEKKDKKYTIENCVNHFELDKAKKTNVGYQYWFIDKDFIDGNTLKMSIVDPHKSTHPPHKHVEEEFFFILEGTATFYLDGKTTTAGAYTSFYCPSNVEHGISNTGDTELKYLVMKKYTKE
ncbi:cupin domain-containing protein [Flavobacterium sp.]|uniref:cupin domain-containing protein n=1 Tax=Flavobacterium sp. TaxID=239 RepID=UPI002B71F4DB|nr:cupin domain-containing protein [Flavobacterium sp.]HSD07867.1 cupin domain-containing protein [Flavobacterium sp.]